MTKGRYSTFKESSTRSSWTTGKMVQRLTSNWLLEYCCGSCYAGQKGISHSELNDATETSRKKNLESVNEMQVLSIDSTKLRNGDQHATEEIPLTNRDYGVSKDDEFLTSIVNKETSLTSQKDNSSIDTSDSKSKSSFSSETLSSGMKLVIESLPVLPKIEKKSLPVNEKKASQSDSELGYTASIFARCSMKYGQQKVSARNIPELIIS